MRAADKILSRTDLAQRAAQTRAAGGKVVFTCGVFDIVHVGHVRYLEFARDLGDMLIVGVNADESVRLLGKGPGRPFVPEQDRAEVIAALQSVSYVCIYPELRPSETILIIRPDIHVKDAAYEHAELPEAAAVTEVGGIVVFAPRVQGRSTTSLLGKMSREKLT